MPEIAEIATFASGTTGFIAELEAKGWVPCDGRPLSTLDAKNTKLFRAIGKEWGVNPADTEHTFRVPDLRGLFLRGWVPAHREDEEPLLFSRDPDSKRRVQLYPPFGAKGESVGSFQDNELGSHNHTLTTQQHGGRIEYADVGQAEWYLGGGDDGKNATHYSGGRETRPRNVYVFYAIFRGI